jgi:uncharacterized membrane protein YccF (DUF307 family)
MNESGARSEAGRPGRLQRVLSEFWYRLFWLGLCVIGLSVGVAGHATSVSRVAVGVSGIALIAMLIGPVRRVVLRRRRPSKEH